MVPHAASLGRRKWARPDVDPGAYLMSAALCDEEDVDTLREAMEALRLLSRRCIGMGVVSNDEPNSSPRLLSYP